MYEVFCWSIKVCNKPETNNYTKPNNKSNNVDDGGLHQKHLWKKNITTLRWCFIDPILKNYRLNFFCFVWRLLYEGEY